MRDTGGGAGGVGVHGLLVQKLPSRDRARQNRLVGDFWGREIPIERINASAARSVDLTKKSEYSPKRRTLGTGIPGYASGWFRLRNGEKALLYLTQYHDVVYVPTYDGYSLLLSVEEADRFVETLQQSNP